MGTLKLLHLEIDSCTSGDCAAIREGDALIEGSPRYGGSLSLFEIRRKTHMFLTQNHILKLINFIKLLSQLLFKKLST